MRYGVAGAIAFELEPPPPDSEAEHRACQHVVARNQDRLNAENIWWWAIGAKRAHAFDRRARDGRHILLF